MLKSCIFHVKILYISCENLVYFMFKSCIFHADLYAVVGQGTIDRVTSSPTIDIRIVLASYINKVTSTSTPDFTCKLTVPS